MREDTAASRRRTRPAAYLVFFLLFSLILFAGHAPFLRLPYFWDEGGQFVPAALDLLHGGHLVPQSVEPNIHPPGVMAYLALAWRLAGFDPLATRSAMVLLAAFSVLTAFLLAIELCREAKGVPAFLAAALLCVSPLFYAQAMMAQLDAPAMLFTALALLFFLQERLRLSAAVCVVLVLVKETGIIVPAVFFIWLARERRWKDALWFAAPAAALGSWIALLMRSTGHWAGDAEFVRYNLYDSIHPLRLGLTFLRRMYYLFVADLHWVGTIAIVYAWRRSRLFLSRSWQVAAVLFAAHVLMLSALGGAALERYLLPVLPILYAAMAAGLSLYRHLTYAVSSIALLIGLVACNFINPPYPFPYENNLAFVDFLRLHASAARFLERRIPATSVQTAWPLTAELSNPELGFVRRPLSVQPLPDLAPATIGSLDFHSVEVLVIYSRTWNPDDGFWRIPMLDRLSRGCCGYPPNITRENARARIPLPLAASFERRGQWVDIYARPQPGPIRAALK